MSKLALIMAGLEINTASPPGTTASKATNLLSLPKEILTQIFHDAREPSLIHTCRILYDMLPSYVDYTGELTVLAFAARFWDVFTPASTPVFHYLTGVALELTERGISQDVLQLELCRSRWLTPAILRAIHVKIYHHALDTALTDPGGLLSESQKLTIQTLCENATQDYRPHMLYARLSNNLWISAAGLHRDRPAVSAELFTISSIPDCILGDAFNTTSVMFLESFQAQSAASKGLTVSTSLMTRAILKALQRPRHSEIWSPDRPDMLSKLLDIAENSPAYPREITIDMIAAAVSSDKAETIAHLLFRASPRARVCGGIQWTSRADIKDLINLQLSIEPHQLACYYTISNAIKATGSEVTHDIAVALGYDSTEALKSARQNKRDQLDLYHYGMTFPTSLST